MIEGGFTCFGGIDVFVGLGLSFSWPQGVWFGFNVAVCYGLFFVRSDHFG